MNEAKTRAEYVDPALKEAGWGVIEGSRILRECHITPGRIQVGNRQVSLLSLIKCWYIAT
ncbi:MAG: type restriction enzyme subunit [Methanolobus sp.]|jgi:type I restriction enzyme R subunit|nr:type restriction enzyme subunit [Methanolobus sp.]MDK2946853.1 type restriction enzyme subunit [Methanolobus sp.]